MCALLVNLQKHKLVLRFPIFLASQTPVLVGFFVHHIPLLSLC